MKQSESVEYIFCFQLFQQNTEKRLDLAIRRIKKQKQINGLFSFSNELKFLEEKIGNVNYQKRGNFKLKYHEFKQKLEFLLQGQKENNSKSIQNLTSLISQFLENNIDKVEMSQIIGEWQRIRDSHLEIQIMLNEDLLDSLVQIPEMLNIISAVAHIHKPKNLYDFYYFLIKEIIETNENSQYNKQIEDREDPENILENLELISIKFIINQKLSQGLENFKNQQKLGWSLYQSRSKSFTF